MAEKSFVVRKGLEVAETLIFTNDEIDSVGIASTQPGGKLTVSGTIEGDGIRLVGFTTAERGINIGVGGTVLSAETNTQKVGINEASPSFPLEIKDPAGIGGTTLFVHGNIGVSTDLIVDETATIQRDLTVNRHCLVSAAGITTLASETKITGDITAHINATSSLSVGSTSDFTGSVSFASSIGGPEAHIDDLTVRRHLFVNATGFSTIASDLSVTGDVTTHLGVTSSLSIGSTSDFTGSVSFASSIGGPEAHIDDLTVRRNLLVSSAGVSTIASDISITGDVTTHLRSTSSLSIGSTSDFTGAISCASSITAPTFFGDGNGLTNINPNEVNLNGTDQRLDDLDVSGIATIATLNVTGVSTFAGDSRFDSSGRLLIGTDSIIDTGGGVGTLQVSGSSASTAKASIVRTNGTSNLTLARGSSGSNATSTISSISFKGYHTDGYKTAASISAVVDGTTGVNTMPGRLVFSTSGLGTDVSEERMRINALGEVGIGTADPKVSLHVVGDSQVSGFVSATNYFGDGSALTNIAADNVDLTGTYQNFQGLTVAGVATITEGLRSVGFSTFLQKVHLLDNVQLQIGGAAEGATGDMRLYHDTSNSYIDDNGTGDLNLRTVSGSSINLIGGSYMARLIKDAEVRLYYNGSKKFETTNDGIDVTGNVGGDTLNISGVGTITGGLVGNVTGNLTGNVTGDVTGNLTGDVTGNVTGNLTGISTGANRVKLNKTAGSGSRRILFVSGSDTEYDAVEIDSQVTQLSYVPATNTLTVDNIVGDLTGDVTGNADTATLAATSTIVAGSGSDRFVNFTDGGTGAQALKSDTSLKYSPSSQTLTTGTVVANLTGNVTGNVTGNTSGSSGSCTGNSVTATTATVATTVTVTPNAANTSYRVPFASAATGNVSLYTDTADGITYNPSTNTLIAGTYNTTSDERIKKNINPIDDALEILSELNGVRFEWKNSGVPSTGVIAQDVEKVLPELVDEVDDVKRVNYDGLIGVLIESVKTLAKRVEELENK